jgi:hypothetical protein
MPASDSLRIVPSKEGFKLSADQKRFNALTQQIAQSRKRLLAWKDNLLSFRQVYTETVVPLKAEGARETRAWLFKLDALLSAGKWSKSERTTVNQIVTEAAGELLASQNNDRELKALFERHAGVDFETDRRNLLKSVKDITEAATGVDLGDDEDLNNEEEFIRRMHKSLEAQIQAHEAEAEREAQAQRGYRDTAAQKRAEQAQQRREREAQLVSQSIREIYRRLASALHPDREPDEVRRNEKTAMMQRVNQAYAANDLLSMLELQLEIEQIDAKHIANASAHQLKHYNKILAEQLEELRDEIELEGMRFRLEFGIDPSRKVNPAMLGDILKELSYAARNELTLQQRITRMLNDVGATKRWLKEERRRAREHPPFDEFFL